MRTFWNGLSRRAKWIGGLFLLAIGWFLNNLFGTLVIDWATAAVKPPGAKRMIARATLFLAAHPYSTFFAIVALAMLWIMLLAYRESKKLADITPTAASQSSPTEQAIGAHQLAAATTSSIPTRNERLNRLREEYLHGAVPNDSDLRPCVIAKYEKQGVLIDNKSAVIEFLRLHNIGWETASDISVSSIVITSDTAIVSFIGQPIKTLDRDEEKMVQFSSSVIDGVNSLRDRPLHGFTIPFHVTYKDRGGKPWRTLHALRSDGLDIQAEPVRDGQHIGFTKFE